MAQTLYRAFLLPSAILPWNYEVEGATLTRELRQGFLVELTCNVEVLLRPQTFDRGLHNYFTRSTSKASNS